MTTYLLHGYARYGDATPALTLESKNGPFYVGQGIVYSNDYEGKQITWLYWRGGPRFWTMDSVLLGFPQDENADRYLDLEWFTIEAKADIEVPLDITEKLDTINARLAVLLNYVDDKRRAEAEGVARAMRSEIDMETATDDLLAMYERDVIPLAQAGTK